MTTFMGCIADDFTGASDLAGLLARSGVRVSLRIGVPAEPPTDTAAFEVVALKIRTEPVDDAVGQARAALAWLQAAGARRFFWKYCSTFDSTAEGNIGPVAEALMHDLRVSQTIYCPAFPENGRSIFMGNLFVGEQLLSESPMKDHPLTPMRDANLMRLLAPQVTKPVGLANRLTVAQGAAALSTRLMQLQDDGVAHVVVDAVADADLQVIAEACAGMPLMTGGSAVAMPLPAIWARAGMLPSTGKARPATTIGPRAIVLSGSCSAMTNAQVAAFLDQGPALRLDPLALADNGVQGALDWLAAQPETVTPLIYATAAPDKVRAVQDRLGAARAGRVIEDALADLARAAHAGGIRRFVVAGGETSGAVTQALGVSQMDIGAEIAPGVPWCFARTGDHQIALALKSGNFGSESFFADALAKLEAA
jgi:uncharacterized protein YgbK (DUF1537 family)